MKIYLDTNIIIDALDPTREGYEDACTILHLAKEHKIELFLSTQSILDTYYSARKHAPSLKLLRQSLFELTQFVNIVSIHQFGVAKALKAGVSDVEDFLNEKGLHLDQVQIVYGLSKFGGDYYVFYDDPDVKPKAKRTPKDAPKDAPKADPGKPLKRPKVKRVPEKFEPLSSLLGLGKEPKVPDPPEAEFLTEGVDF